MTGWSRVAVSEDRHTFACKMNAPPALRVLVVDDSPQVRQAIGNLLKKSAEVELVGEASNAREAIWLNVARTHKPDLVLLDIIGHLNASDERTRRGYAD
jgi:PleD family two-component response regulator